MVTSLSSKTFELAFVQLATTSPQMFSPVLITESLTSVGSSHVNQQANIIHEISPTSSAGLFMILHCVASHVALQ